MRTWIIAGLTASIAATLTPVAAKAQAQLQGPPPSNFSVDERGVDLVRGSYNLSTTDVVIGQPGAGGLVYSRAYVGPGWRDSITGTIEELFGGSYYVSIAGVSEVFNLTGGVFVPTRNVGATLVDDGYGGHIFTTADGVAYTFNPPDGSYASPTDADKGRLGSIAYPNGEIVTYSYKGIVVPTGNPNDPRVPAIRVQSISNNRGYQIKLTYQANTATSLSGLPNYYKVIGATGFNMAVDYCAPTAVSCTYSRTWPSATYSVSGATQTVTDQASRVTTYTFSSNNVASITAPGSSSADIAISYSGGLVSSVASAMGTWTYGYADSGSTRTTTVTDSLSNHWTAVSNLSTGLLTSWSNPYSQTTSYAYDSQGRPTTVTLPEGNHTDYTYDTRGNVTLTTISPKPGSTAPVITTSAVYPTTCSAAPNCNKPTSTTDARNNTTDYVWNATHGGLERVQLPLPTSTATVRPETRISYSAQTAYYKNSAGTIVAAPSSITLPVSNSACATNAAPACLGTIDEVKTTFVYGATGVANNLLPTSTTSGDGAGTLAATTTVTYDPNGDVATMDGSLAGSNDTTRYVYDVARQRVGVMGPDPDAGGGLLNRSQRVTYNARGQVTLTEVGTTTGNGAGDWSSFSTLQRQETTYDSYGRPVVARQQDAGGTTLTLQQVGYDAMGRPQCTAIRMNPSAFSGLPGSTGACTPTALGAFGPDRIVLTTYDAANRPVSATSGVGTPAPITEAVSYTANSKPQNLTDGNGNVSTLVYDDFDRAGRLHYPNATGGGVSATDFEWYGYDAASNLTFYQNRAGQAFNTSYDNLNREVYVTPPIGSGMPGRGFTYDNLSRVTHGDYGSTDFTNIYDGLSRILTQGQLGIGNVDYQYDLAGRRTRVTWPDAFYVSYDYDYGNDLTAVRENGNPAWALATTAYDNLGRRIATGLGNGVVSSWSYDGIGRLTGLSHDLAGTSQDLSLGYSYNPASQIVSRSVSNNTYVYVPSNSGTTYANNGLNQVTGLTGTGGTTIGYDANQNITTGLGTTYVYDALNQLTLAGSAGFTYDSLGRLSRSTGSSTRRYLYDGQQVIGEYNDTGGLLSRYVPGFGLNDIVSSYDTAANRSWPLADERQSVVAISNGAGAAFVINTYDEYGVPASGNGGLFQYTGQMWLADAGLYHYRARAYAPQIGRFLQTDPSGYSAGMNLYAYSGGDPVNFSDPLGLEYGKPITPGECIARHGVIVPTQQKDVSHCVDGGGPSVGFGDSDAYDLGTVNVFGSRVTKAAFQRSPDRCEAFESPVGPVIGEYNPVGVQAKLVQKYTQHLSPFNTSGTGLQSVFTAPYEIMAPLASITPNTHQAYVQNGGPIMTSPVLITADAGFPVGYDVRSGRMTNYFTMVFGPPNSFDKNGVPNRPLFTIYPGCP